MYWFILIFTFYIILFAIIFKNNSKVVFGISFIYLFVLSVIFGVRYDVGVDYLAYENYYYNSYDAFKMETGYSFLNYYFYNLGLPFFAVTIFMSMVTNFFAFLGVYLSGLRGSYFFLAILIYSSNLMLLSLNGMRQALATTIVFAFSIYILKSKFVSFLIGCFIASMFHSSALLFLPVYLARNILIKKFILIFIFLLFFLSFISTFFLDFNSLFVYVANHIPYYSKYASYLDRVEASGVGFGVFIRFIFAFVLMFFFFYRYNSHSNVHKFWVSLFLIGLILNFLSVSNFLWGRVGMYFYIFEILAIPYIISNITNSKLKTVLYLSAILYCLAFLYALVLNEGLNNLIYKSIFSEGFYDRKFYQFG